LIDWEYLAKMKKEKEQTIIVESVAAKKGREEYGIEQSINEVD